MLLLLLLLLLLGLYKSTISEMETITTQFIVVTHSENFDY